MAGEEVECPVCGKNFASNEINTHVNLCLSGQAKCETADRTRKDESLSEPHEKRRKVDVVKAPALEAGGGGSRSTKSWTFMMKTKSLKSPKAEPSQQFGATVQKEKPDEPNKSVCNTKDPSPFISVHSKVPLAERMRPVSLDEYVGQEQALGRKKLLRSLFEAVKLPSMIFWGPPGCGKTTLARIVAQKCKESHNTRFTKLSATTSGVADVKEAVKVAKTEWSMFKRTTVLFIDEVHRFNKLQQDSFLPHVEDGTIVLLGATTENPSFHVNNALLSRCKVIVLEKLSPAHVTKILRKAIDAMGICVLSEDSSLRNKPERPVACVEEDAIVTLASLCDGDARAALNNLETAVKSKVTEAEVSAATKYKPTNFESAHRVDNKDGTTIVITVKDVKDAMLEPHLQYDRNGEEHYNCASALQKSIRGSDASAAVYWMTRMFEGGEDPLYIARRLVVTASEDIGLADSQALPLAVSTFQACQVIGRPECALNLAHCVTYLARAPKSRECANALHRARDLINQNSGPQPAVPLHLRNAPTRLMKNLGYGKGYVAKPAPNTDHLPFLPTELKDIDLFAGDSDQ